MFTPVPKPTSTSYTNVNAQGREQYDQATLMYDDPNTFYDGVDFNQWSEITKPASTPWTNIVKPS